MNQNSTACVSQVDFLLELQRLDDPAPPPCPAVPNEADANGRSARELPERSAARGLFRWEVRGADLPEVRFRFMFQSLLRF